MDSINKKIFISIPSYEDELLLETINDALLKAENPSRLVFGVALQYKEILKPDLSFLGNQLKLIEYDVDTRPGIIQIRKEIADLIEDEEYFFGIDAHTLFAKNWDSKYIKDYNNLVKQYGNDKVCIASVISKDPQQFIPSINYQYYDINWVLNVNEEDVYKSWWDWPPILKKYIPGSPEYIKRYIVSANNWFLSTSFFKNQLFWSFNKSAWEEPQISLSLFLNGYDVYYPTNKAFVISNYKSETRNRSNKIHWKNDRDKNWNMDDHYVDQEVFKLFYTGKSSLFTIDNVEDIYKWWDAIGLYYKAKRIEELLNN
jgi:hypothetical protein